jgi:hypothetical protein
MGVERDDSRDKKPPEQSATARYEELDAAALANLLLYKLAALDAARTTAKVQSDTLLSAIETAVSVLRDFGVPLKPKYEPPLTLHKALWEIHRDKVRREIAHQINRRVDFWRTYNQLFDEPKRIQAWARGGKFQKMAKIIASELETPINLLMSLRAAQTAKGRPSSQEIAKSLREEARLRQALAARVLKERAERMKRTASKRSANTIEAKIEALIADGTFSRKLGAGGFAEGGTSQRLDGEGDAPAAGGRKLQPLRWWPSAPHRLKPALQKHFAEALLEVCKEYLAISTQLKNEPGPKSSSSVVKGGAIVELGRKLAPIWNITPPSGELFAKVKRQTKS